jgi:hypothetical protein
MMNDAMMGASRRAGSAGPESRSRSTWTMGQMADQFWVIAVARSSTPKVHVDNRYS